MATYSELLRDPRWQKMRLKKLEAAGWKCQRCADGGTTLHVHHKRYVKGRSPWEYDEEELVVLCEPCHEAAHPLAEARSALLARLDEDGPSGIDVFMAAGSAWVSVYSWRDEKLSALVEDAAAAAPSAYAACRFALNLSFSTVSRKGFEHLVDLTDDAEGEFYDELTTLFRKHGVAFLGDPS